MNNALAATVRLGVVIIGCVLMFASGFEGWVTALGLFLVMDGAWLIVMASREAALHAEDPEPFRHVHFEDDDEDHRR